MLLHLTNETFSQTIAQADKPVLVEFHAPWCVYCRRLAPALRQAADAYEGRVPFAQVDIDEAPAVAEQFGIDTVPTLLLFRDGKPGEPLVAPGSKAAIDSWLKEQGVE